MLKGILKKLALCLSVELCWVEVVIGRGDVDEAVCYVAGHFLDGPVNESLRELHMVWASGWHALKSIRDPFLAMNYKTTTQPPGRDLQSRS